ncbi:hypothetical protein AA700_0660 [Acidiphilium acidophilum DSM 700]|nr:hypothetical protein AA700_0660 [Acidiphilium acidophilum DSM 700]
MYVYPISLVVVFVLVIPTNESIYINVFFRHYAKKLDWILLFYSSKNLTKICFQQLLITIQF